MTDLIQFKHFRFSNAEQSRVIYIYVTYYIYFNLYDFFLPLNNFIMDGRKALNVKCKIPYYILNVL